MTISISNIRWYMMLLPMLLLVACGKTEDEPTPAPQPEEQVVVAFPGADGGGRYTTGGRGGAVYVVNSLEDNILEPQPGTLRFAMNASGARLVVFTVAGRIDLQGQLEVKSGNLTVLGQSAPGDGICISGYPVVVRAGNVVMRFLRFRMGDVHAYEGDALTIDKGVSNVLIDHCSCSWSTDECLSIYGVENATVQYCFITESLNNSVHEKIGGHGYGGIWGGKNTSFHHNLLAHHKSRNPRFDHDYVLYSTDKSGNGSFSKNAGVVDYINNVVYNWKDNSCYGGESVSLSGNTRHFNFVNNYYKPGPATGSGVKARLINPTTKCGNCTQHGGSVVPGVFYVAGNTMFGSSAVTADNWQGVSPDESSKKEQCRSTSRFSFDNAMTGEQTADAAYEKVLAVGGCSYQRDAIDARIVNEVRNGTSTYVGSNGSKGGIIDTQEDCGGWPSYQGGEKEKDSDGDHIPDAWESAHGLDPNNAKDAKLTTLSAPYMNIEVYLNDLVKDLY